MTGISAAKVKAWGKPKSVVSLPHMHCPGCGYGILLRITAEVIDEMGLTDIAIGVSPGGCAGPDAMWLDFDMMNAAHGRAQTVTTGIKRVHPDSLVFCWQGDGDVAAIGLGGFMHAMLRGEKYTTIVLNNAGYGSTGGQMSPTTPLGMHTSTTAAGRDPRVSGVPFRIAELAASMPTVAFAARVSIHTPAHYQKAKQAVRRAFEKQMANVGYTLVEFLSPCPPNWGYGLTPVKSLKFIEETLIPAFPLGVFKDVDSVEYTMWEPKGDKKQ